MVAKRFMALVVLVLVVGFYSEASTAKDDEDGGDTCEASWCGHIRNISHPFRLKQDPLHCGDQRYELSCEHNETILYLYSGKYYVHAINYNNYTIRVVDFNVLKGNFSNSLPWYSLSQYNFSANGPYRTVLFQTDRKIRSLFYRFSNMELSKPIIFMSCEAPIAPLNSSDVYIDTSPCIGGGWHSFAKIGDMIASDLRDLCRVDLILVTSWPATANIINNSSCIEFHNEVLLYGFELSWLQSYDRGLSTCYIAIDTNKVECSSHINGILWAIPFFLRFIFERCIPFYVAARTIFGFPFVIALLIYKWKRRHLSMYGVIEEFLQSHNNLMPIRYSYKDIKKMTKGFKHKLGEGGYGLVYRGKLRSGSLVAVKILDKSSKANGQDFINEVATIGRIHHVNVVQLIGYCVEGSKRCLIYNFMPNGSLDKYIFHRQGHASLSCKELFEISLGVARGINYLHQGCEMQIFHFDIKPHNILLDENFVPKVSDFGLARLCPLDESSLTLTAARGTIGYIAPELFYKNIGGVSNKADIYSFGMLLMEMAGKRKNLNAVASHSSQIYFPLWVYEQFSEGREVEIEDSSEEEMKMAKKMLIVALWCIQLKPSERPNSMSKVVEMLEGEIESLQIPPKPFLYPQDKPVVDDEEDSETTCSSALLKDEGDDDANDQSISSI